MIVEVKPIERSKWHGKTGKDNYDQPVTFEVLYDPEVGGYATGLTPDEQKEYEEKTGLDLSNNFNPEKPHPFWSTSAARIKLPNHPIVFDTDKSMDYIKVKNLKASILIANSVRDVATSPHATHVIYDESEEVEIKATKIQKKNKARKLSFKLSKDEKINLIQVISGLTVRGRSDDFVDVEIDKIVEEKTDEFLKYAGMDKDEVYTRAAVLEAVHRNILTKEGSSIYYMGDKLGYDIEEVIKWFLNPQNQQMKVAILEKLNSN